LVFVLLTMVWMGVHRAAAQPTQPTLAEIADRMRGVNPTLRTFIVDQVVDARVLAIFRWRLNTTMYASRPASYKVIIHNPPPLLGRFADVVADVSSPEQVLANYRGAAIRPAPNNRLVLDLVGVSPSVNPPALTAIVDGAHWVAEDLLLKYAWGDVHVVYHYELIEGFLLPATARVDVPRFTFGADVAFVNYRLNVPIPPGTFDDTR
jgi:hypothetical protein